MGKELKKIFKALKKSYGDIAIYRLSVKVLITESQAGSIEDTEELILKIIEAVDELGYELKF